jgi:four helix bundle protein
MSVQSYQPLIAWQKGMDFAVEIYRATDAFPKQELYGIVSQLRRASVSIPSDIAEGQGRRSTGEFRQFLGNARGSLLETETQILLAQRLEYLPPSAAECLLKRTAELGKILNGLMTSLLACRR